jgi:HAD superfamily hydrolase (TIGR01459 family)
MAAVHRSAEPYEPLSTLACQYDVILCDIWGVIHNGAAVFPEAVTALRQFRLGGGSVILLSNASRLGTMVAAELQQLEGPTPEYDALVTSGDVTRDLVSAQPGCSVFDLGPGDTRPILEGLEVLFTTPHHADLAVTSGAFHGMKENLESLQPLLVEMRIQDLPLLCANPDVITELAGLRVQCSGAVAERYAELGGYVTYAGKPQPPIYERALAVAASLRHKTSARERVLVIGDSLRTDIAGAVANGFASLFVSAGIHARELGARPSADDFQELFVQENLVPTAVTHRLVW